MERSSSILKPSSSGGGCQAWRTLSLAPERPEMSVSVFHTFDGAGLFVLLCWAVVDVKFSLAEKTSTRSLDGMESSSRASVGRSGDEPFDSMCLAFLRMTASPPSALTDLTVPRYLAPLFVAISASVSCTVVSQQHGRSEPHTRRLPRRDSSLSWAVLVEVCSCEGAADLDEPAAATFDQLLPGCLAVFMTPRRLERRENAATV